MLVLGGGAPSTSLLLMALAGTLPRLDAVIFPDTGFEPRAVMAHAARLEPLAHAAGVAFYRAAARNLRDDATDPFRSYRRAGAGLPLYVAEPDGRATRLPPRCATRYRAEPVRRQLDELRQMTGRLPVELWLGLTREDATRAPRPRVATSHSRSKRSKVRYRFPLIERGLTRADCQRWLAARGWTAPTAGCVGCPLQSDLRWLDVRHTTPPEWAEAATVDRAIRTAHPDRGEAFLHRSLVPLEHADLHSPPERAVIDGFGAETEGMCAT